MGLPSFISAIATDPKSILTIGITLPSLAVNAWYFLLRPFSSKHLLCGRWQGTLDGRDAAEINISMALFPDNGAIAGYILYSGVNFENKNVKGVDQLFSDLDRIEFKRVWPEWYQVWKFPISSNLIVLYMKQDFHIIDTRMQDSTVGASYRYELRVIRRRFWRQNCPRLHVGVSTRPEPGQQPIQLGGQIYKLRGG